MKKLFTLIGILFLLALAGCTSADIYRLNYSDDPAMQDKMIRDYGDVPFWQD